MQEVNVCSIFSQLEARKVWADGSSLCTSVRFGSRNVREGRLTQPISAIDYDPDIRPFKWTPVLAEFVADVQSATEAVLHDSPALQEIWHQLSLRIASEMGAVGLPEPRSVPAKDARDLARKCFTRIKATL
jgi:hypothetical protein